MKAIFIDSKAQTVEQIWFTGNYKDIQAKLGVQCFTVLTTKQNDSCYADDEGLLNGTEDFFWCKNVYPNPIAGNALILGCTEDGDDTDCAATVESLGTVKFLHRDEVAKFYSPKIHVISF